MSERRSSRVPTKRKRLAEPLSDDDSFDADLDFKKYIKQKVINLSSKGLNDDDLDVLYQIIEQSNVIEKLDLGVNHLTLADGKFANAIAKNTTLKVLWLSDNNINLQGARHLANALKQNNTPLKDLDLAGNNIGDGGAEYIAEMLAVNKTLQKIYLGKNNIGDKGAESIATSLLVNTGIREIYLDWNNITDMGVQKLADALESNHNIGTLDSSHNKKISKDVRGRINAIFKDPKRKMLIANKMNNTDQVVTRVTLLDNNNDGINSSIGRDPAIGIGMKPTPEQYEQLMAADRNSKQSSASSLTNSESISDQKMPASNNKRDTENPLVLADANKMPAVSTDIDDDGIVVKTPKGPSTSFLKVEVEDALKYMDRVRREFGDQSHIYNEFLVIMKDLKAQKVDTIGVINRVRRLFHGHNNMILGFNTFLPNGYKIELKEGYKPPPETKRGSRRERQPQEKRQRLSEPIVGGLKPQRLNFDPLSSSPGSKSSASGHQSSKSDDIHRAIDYVTTVRKRFAPEIYRKFLQILHEYQKTERGIKEVIDEVSLLFEDHVDLLKGFVFFIPDAFQAQAKKQLEGAIKKAEEKKKVSRLVNDDLSKQKDLTRDRIEDSSKKKNQRDDELTKVKEQLNSALKEKEDALKSIASMKADITRKEEAIQMKEQEIKSRDTDIAQIDQQLKSAKVEVRKVKSLEEENRRLKNELADAQKKVAERDIDITNKNKQLESIKRILNPTEDGDEPANKQHRTKDQTEQLKSALDGIIERDKDIAKEHKQLESIKRILNPVTDDEGEPATKRHRTENTPSSTKPKIMSAHLDYEHTHCSICHSKFSTDTNNKDEDIRKHLPVLSASSKSCDHYFCHGCILKQQAAIAEQKRVEARKWIPCMVCKTKTSFCPSEPKNHRLLIDILKKAKWVDAPQVKEEPID